LFFNIIDLRYGALRVRKAYRITTSNRKENDMSRLTNSVLAACAALVLFLTSIGAIVTVPPAHAAAIATFSAPELA